MTEEEHIRNFTHLIRTCKTQDQVDNLDGVIEKKYGFVPPILMIVLSNQRTSIYSDNVANQVKQSQL